ncbi:MAG: threonine--tRNA ligase [Deltaproteobacteria bacterium]|nr:threonine--tRNA ligase [Deltaproteobacteria bacterium]
MSNYLKISFPSGTVRDVPRGSSAREALELDGHFLAVAASIADKAVDINAALYEDCSIVGIEANSQQGLEIIRHSASHIMAEAVKSLFPAIKVAIGPAIESGFYYDFEREEPFTSADLELIEQKMREIIAEDGAFSREEMSRSEATLLFEKLGESYKVELINDLPPEVTNVSIYRQGDFVDLCRGPHIASTGKVGAFKLLSVAGAYWRGDEKNKMLQRIYGTAFSSKQELDEYLHLVEEAKRRDHRRIGKDLDLFQVSEEAGAGLVIFHPKGMMLRYLIEEWERKEHIKRGYQMVMGPQILKADLWKLSGHYDNYRENMYFTEVDGQSYGIKPMNCISHMLIYKSQLRSYRDLPIRYFELGTVHRHEKAGVLHGLMRVRQFTQDDAHIICTPEQLSSEIKGVADFVATAMQIFGFEYEVELSTRPVKSIGSDSDWELATSALRGALVESAIPYDVHQGDGAFYGPKIDFKIKDALNRKWQCATIQCDFTLPERFELHYIGEDGLRHRPVMLHRVILGAIERFMGVLIEHFAGAFPLWLSPVQAVVVTVTDKHIPYGQKVLELLKSAGIRSEGDFRNEKLGYKVREAQLQKTPYALVVGDKEIENGTVALRKRGGEQLPSVSVEEFIREVVSLSQRYE